MQNLFLPKQNLYKSSQSYNTSDTTAAHGIVILTLVPSSIVEIWQANKVAPITSVYCEGPSPLQMLSVGSFPTELFEINSACLLHVTSSASGYLPVMRRDVWLCARWQAARAQSEPDGGKKNKNPVSASSLTLLLPLVRLGVERDSSRSTF